MEKKKEKISVEEEQAWDNAFGNENVNNGTNSEYSEYDRVMNNASSNVSSGNGNNDGLNNAALALSIISFFMSSVPLLGTALCIAALILSIKARAKHTSAATASLVVSIIALAFRVISIIIYVFAFLNYMYVFF